MGNNEEAAQVALEHALERITSLARRVGELEAVCWHARGVVYGTPVEGELRALRATLNRVLEEHVGELE